jgi:hypothetical protein
LKWNWAVSLADLLKCPPVAIVQFLEMKITRLPVVALALVGAVTTFAGMEAASAQVNLGIRIGGGPPPPPPHYYHRGPGWARPYRGAVWIDGENAWRDGRWVWVGGYWAYPPYPGAAWIPGHYRNGYWRAGHWRR